MMSAFVQRPAIRRLRIPTAECLLEQYSNLQHLRPHRPLLEMVAGAQPALPAAIGESAIAWLELDPATSIGRLRRTELVQLARAVHRLWRQSIPSACA